MISFDTNLVIHAANSRAPEQRAAASFLQSLGARRDVVICELMLVEVRWALPLNPTRRAGTG